MFNSGIPGYIVQGVFRVTFFGGRGYTLLAIYNGVRDGLLFYMLLTMVWGMDLYLHTIYNGLRGGPQFYNVKSAFYAIHYLPHLISLTWAQPPVAL